jgi:sorting nexin-1/2
MEKKIASIDSLELQLKEIYKVMDGFVRQRKEFAQVTGELGQNFIDLAKAEVNEDLSHNLTLFGNLQQAVKVFHEKQVFLGICGLIC